MRFNVSVLLLTHCHDAGVFFLDVTQCGMSLGMTSGRIRRGSSYSADSEEGHRTDAECNLPQLMSLVGTTMYMFSRAFI